MEEEYEAMRKELKSTRELKKAVKGVLERIERGEKESSGEEQRKWKDIYTALEVVEEAKMMGRLTEEGREELERVREHYKRPRYYVYLLMDEMTRMKYVGMTLSPPLVRYIGHFSRFPSRLVKKRAELSGWKHMRMFTLGTTTMKKTALEAEVYFMCRFKTLEFQGLNLSRNGEIEPRLRSDFEVDVREVDVSAAHWLFAHEKRLVDDFRTREAREELVGLPREPKLCDLMAIMEKPEEEPRPLTEEEEDAVMTRFEEEAFPEWGLETMWEMLMADGHSQMIAMNYALNYSITPVKERPSTHSAYGLCHWSQKPDDGTLDDRVGEVICEAEERLAGTDQYAWGMTACQGLLKGVKDSGRGGCAQERQTEDLSARLRRLANVPELREAAERLNAVLEAIRPPA